MERFVPKNIGDQISAGNVIMVDGISSIVSVRYNGITDTYDVCNPARATHDAIISDDDHCILIKKDCQGHEALTDIL